MTFRFLRTCRTLRSVVCGLSFSLSAFAESEPKGALQVDLDVSACLATEAGASLERALRVEVSTLNADVRFVQPVRNGDPSPGKKPVAGAQFSYKVTTCDLRAGRIVVEAVTTVGDWASMPCSQPPEEWDANMWRCRQVMEFHDVPEVALPRTAAVAVSEWLRSLLELPPPERSPSAALEEPEGAAEDNPVGDPAAETIGGPERTYHISLVGHAALHGAAQTTLYGVSVSVGASLAARLSIEAEGRYGYSTRQAPLGRVAADWLGVAVGPDFQVDDQPDLRIGSRFGVAEVTGRGDSRLGITEEEQVSFVAVVLLRAQLRVPLRGDWSAVTAVDVGSYVHGVVFEAGGDAAFSFTGVFAESRLGLGYSF